MRYIVSAVLILAAVGVAVAFIFCGGCTAISLTSPEGATARLWRVGYDSSATSLTYRPPTATEPGRFVVTGLQSQVNAQAIEAISAGVAAGVACPPAPTACR